MIYRRPQKLAGELWGIVTFFNPAGYANKYQNFRTFRDASRGQGLKLLVVELGFGDEAFEMKDSDAELIVRLRGGREHMFWQKEALLNIGLKHLPTQCDKVAWVDCDVLFLNDDWVRETSANLEEYVVVQPFADTVRLGRKQTSLEPGELAALPRGSNIMERQWSSAYLHATSGVIVGAHPGFAWCERRSAASLHGFYDASAVGSADLFMMMAFVNQFAETPKMLQSGGVDSRSHLYEWMLRASAIVQQSVSYTSGTVLHLWHGEQTARRYTFWLEFVRNTGFDPRTDLFHSAEGLCLLGPNCQLLDLALKEFYLLRKEDVARD